MGGRGSGERGRVRTRVLFVEDESGRIWAWSGHGPLFDPLLLGSGEELQGKRGVAAEELLAVAEPVAVKFV